MNIPILGIVENMSYFECPDCHKKHSVFGESHIENLAKQFGIDCVSKIPIDPSLANNCDNGVIELFEGDWLENLADKIEGMHK